MRVVDAEALIDAIQARIRVARADGDGRAEDALDDAIGLVHKLLQAPKDPAESELVADLREELTDRNVTISAMMEAGTPKPVADAPYGTRILVWWREKWHIASFHTDCPGCPGESCPHCHGASEDYWRDGNGELHEGMDENWPACYLSLPADPVPV